jgi:glycosyltransferase involved in cell wall biosynthesis
VGKKLLYLSCHITLESDELELFDSLGFTSVTIGNFLIPGQPYHKNKLIKHPLPWSLHEWKEPTFKRDLELSQEFLDLNPNFEGVNTFQRIKLNKEYLDKFDAIVVTYTLPYLSGIIQLNPKCPIILRAVGQTDLRYEQQLKIMRPHMTLVRYATGEENAQNYAGADRFICASVSEEFFDREWIGDTDEVMTVCRAMQERAKATNYQTFVELVEPFDAKIYGSGNENIPKDLNGGELTHEQLLEAYSKNRVFVTTGSAPGPIVYTFIEALAVGIPTVSLGPNLARKYTGPSNLYAIDRHVQQGVNGFYSDNIKELQGYINDLRKDDRLCQQISKNGIEYARNNFSRKIIAKQWKELFKNLGVL